MDANNNTDGNTDNIYQEATLNQLLTPEDFEQEFGRPRSQLEQQEYDMFSAAVMLADPDVTITCWKEDDS